MLGREDFVVPLSWGCCLRDTPEFHNVADARNLIIRKPQTVG